MCMPVVLDASAFDVVNQDSPGTAGEHLRLWLSEGHGRVAYSTYDRCGTELRWDKKVWALVQAYRRRGVADRIAAASVKREEERLRALATRSGEKDRQILALAAAADARVMVVRDKNLKDDFEDSQFLPKTPGQRRMAFPIKAGSAAQRDFLERRRCPRRERQSRSRET